MVSFDSMEIVFRVIRINCQNSFLKIRFLLANFHLKNIQLNQKCHSVWKKLALKNFTPMLESLEGIQIKKSVPFKIEHDHNTILVDK